MYIQINFARLDFPIIVKCDHVCMGHFTLAVPPACPQHYVGGLH